MGKVRENVFVTVVCYRVYVMDTKEVSETLISLNLEPSRTSIHVPRFTQEYSCHTYMHI